jgi:hypothetical protein
MLSVCVCCLSVCVCCVSVYCCCRFEYLKSRINSSPVGYPGGSYPIQFLLLALYRIESDHGSLAFDVLTSDKKHGWIAMMRDFNATTTMECWSPTELVRTNERFNSLRHT